MDRWWSASLPFPGRIQQGLHVSERKGHPRDKVDTRQYFEKKKMFHNLASYRWKKMFHFLRDSGFREFCVMWSIGSPPPPPPALTHTHTPITPSKAAVTPIRCYIKTESVIYDIRRKMFVHKAREPPFLVFSSRQCPNMRTILTPFGSLRVFIVLFCFTALLWSCQYLPSFFIRKIWQSLNHNYNNNTS